MERRICVTFMITSCMIVSAGISDSLENPGSYFKTFFSFSFSYYVLYFIFYS